MSCPFCGSEKYWIETPFMDLITGKKKEVPCCSKQKTNMEYQKKRFVHEDAPSLEEIANDA